jgi:streptogrisin C
MPRSRKTAVAVAGLVAATLAGTASSALAEPASDVRGGAPDAAVSAYQAAFPKISLDGAKLAAAGQEDRKELYQLLAGKEGGKAFGGAWFDPMSNVLHVATTDASAADGSVSLGKELDVNVDPVVVEHSYADLEAQAAEIRARKDTVGSLARSYLGIDVKRNAVVMALSSAQTTAYGDAVKEAGATIVSRQSLKTQYDSGCTSRAACDWTIRGGSMLWTGSAGNNVCSVGFTARTSTNTRYTYTAGHCSGGNGIQWGTGGQNIGPMVSSRNTGPVDASVIRVDNPWFKYDSGGEMYNQFSAGKSVAVNAVAPTLSYIWSGDVVCLAANYTSPNGSSFCGIVNTNSDPSVRGMVRVDGLDGCPGDSGGAWYWLTNSGRRIAYGLHSRSDIGCHGDQGGSHSWFSALPTIKNTYQPSLNVETRP